MKNYEIKNIDGGILDVDDKTRRVKAAFNKVEVVDHDEEIIDGKAYDKTIMERGPKGKGLIWHLTDHTASLKHAVARFKELYMESQHLVGVTDIPNTAWGNDVLEFYKTGNINQHSIGFKPTKKSDKDKNGVVRISEVMLYEGSAVLWGANENTPTLSTGKSLTKQETKDEFEKTIEELHRFHKLFKTGHLTDECFELIEVKIAQLTDKLQHLFKLTTQPAAEAVEPEMKDVFNNFINTFKRQDNGQERIIRTA